jgi:hypothetical protein
MQFLFLFHQIQRGAFFKNKLYKNVRKRASECNFFSYFIKFKEGLFSRINFTKQLSGKGRKEERLLLMHGYFKRKQQPK